MRGQRIFSDLPLREKGLVVVSIPVISLLVVLTALIFVQREEQTAEGWIAHTYEVRQKLQVALTLLVDAETGTRGYLLTGKQEWLEPYRSANAELPREIAALESLVADNPGQKESVRQLSEAAETRMNGLVALQRHAAPIRPGELDGALNSSKASMDRIRSLFGAMQAAEERLLAERTANVQRVRRWLYVLSAGAVGAGLGGGVLAALLLGVQITRRIERLTESATRLARREPLLTADPHRDEIGRFAEVLGETDRLLTAREHELRETQTFLEHLVETSPAVIFRQDPETLQVNYVSPNVERILGYTPAETLAAKDFWLAHVHPEDRERVLARDKEAFDNRAGQVEIEYRFLHKDGSYRWIVSFTRIEYDEAGKPSEFIGHRLDITPRKAAEGALLERQVNLDAANKELEAFSYSVSHDLRSPLRSIDGFSQALIEEYEERLDGPGKGYLQRVRAATQRMGELIDDLLNLSRVTRVPLRRSSVNLSALAQSIAADLRASQPERKVDFAIEPDLEEDCDASLLRVVLENLLGNAWKFTSKRAAASIEFYREGRTYFVRDNGAGFDPTYKSKLFGAFQRLHGPADFGGTGIGLATVQRIIRRHGGKVSADGAPNQGATFTFTLRS